MLPQRECAGESCVVHTNREQGLLRWFIEGKALFEIVSGGRGTVLIESRRLVRSSNRVDRKGLSASVPAWRHDEATEGEPGSGVGMLWVVRTKGMRERCEPVAEQTKAV